MSSSRRSKASAAHLDGVEDLWTKLSSCLNDEAGPDSARKRSMDGVATSESIAKETFTLFLGQHQAGKSSVITAFHNPAKAEDKPKPTVALEYLFARKSAGPNQPKDVAHIWELGGGAKLSDLIDVPLNPSNLPTATAVVVVDLSKPQNLISGLLWWLATLRKHLEVTLKRMRDTTQTEKAHAILDSAGRRFPSDHPDRSSIRPMPIPTVIVANKFDAYKSLESVQRKLIAQALRFIAHFNGATLVAVSHRDKSSQNTLRAHLTHHLFNTAPQKRVETNAEKQLNVPAGADSFESILKSVPKGADAADFINRTHDVTDVAMDVWRSLLRDMFGEEDASHEQELQATSEGTIVGGEGEANRRSSHGADDEESRQRYAEPLVDEAREERDLALAKYRKEVQRRKRLEASGKRSSSKSSSSSSSSSKSSSKSSSRSSKSSRK